jgi:L-alanine-DL-glutamate epimerase-like enolase superfamily enzyme
MSADLRIDRAEIVVVGPPTERLTWAVEMDGQFMTHTILKLTTAGGLVGLAGAASYAEGGYECSVAETLRPLLGRVLGRTPLEREALRHQIRSRTLIRAPQAQALIDVALWDLTAKLAGLPLHQLLGGARTDIEAYASTPLLESPDAYVDCVAQYRDQGFRAIKFHCWCEPGRDLAMLHAVARAYPDPPVALMLDVEQRYDRQSARRVGQTLADLGYAWFEAPLDDHDLLGYRELSERLSIPVLPGGNAIIDPQLIAFAVSHGCWRRVRIDAMSCGGITPALEVMALARSHGMGVELQCWGYTLAQATNLHLMLGQPGCTYFEQPTPYEPFEFGTIGAIRPDAEGLVRAPPGPGLGVEVDWAAIHSATIARHELRADGRPFAAGGA